MGKTMRGCLLLTSAQVRNQRDLPSELAPQDSGYFRWDRFALCGLNVSQEVRKGKDSKKKIFISG